MIKNEQILVSKVDGLPLSMYVIRPEKTCKGVIQILHGMSEYKDRYLPVMQFLADHGYASVIHDHRGHGKSVRSESDFGYMYEVGCDGFLEDVLLVNEYAHQQFSGVPFVLFGHSMGTLAARAFLKEHDELVDLVILTGPPCANSVVDMGILIAKVQKRVKGALAPAYLLSQMSIGAYCKAFQKEPYKSAWICSDTEVVQKYESDSKCGFIFTVDGYEVLLNLLKRTYQKDGWKCSKADLPILYLGGSEDPCIGGNDKFTHEMEVMKQVGYRNVSGKMYEGMRHEICNEKGKEQVYQDILNFIMGNEASSLS